MPKRASRTKSKPAIRAASTAGVLGDDPSVTRDAQGRSKKKGPSPATNILPASLAEYEILAHQRLTRVAWEYINSGSADENTMRWNIEALTQMRLKPSVMVDVSKIDTRTKLFGHEMPHPILIAPTSSHFLAHCDGEIATARGAGAAGAIMVGSN